MTTLYLCEKPSQGRDIAKVLGIHKSQDGYIEGNNIIVTWCVGHLLETAPPDYYRENLKPWRMQVLPVVPTTWHMQPVERTKKQLGVIRKLLKKINHVVIVTDADREGEVIAREVLEFCGYNGSLQRLWLSALDDVSIKKALAKLRANHETEKLYDAGLGRQRADWLIGMNMTMAASCLFGQRGQGVLSVGRVQTPTLKLVVDRDHTIENFKPKDYYILLAQFTTEQNEAFWTKWQVPENEADSEGRCLNKNVIETLAKKVAGQKASVKEFKQAEQKQAPPLCLSLSSLQKLASSRFGFSAKKTLDIAQTLYETHKLTTYPRTDCGYLPEDQYTEAPIILNALIKLDNSLQVLIDQCEVNFKSPTWNDKKITAHHGIIPTQNKNSDLRKLSADESKIYDLIRRHYIAQFLGDYVYSNRQVTVICQEELFKASSNTPLRLGWKRVLQDQLESSDQSQATFANTKDDHFSIIPNLQSNQMVLHADQRIEAKQTKPPARFTEGTLIDAMKNVGKFVTDTAFKKILKETAGIGTEATRAAILETLFKREYLAKQGKQLISTQKGRALITLLPSVVTNPVTTAQWEQALENVAEGKLKLDSFLIQQAESLQTMLDALAAKKASEASHAANIHSSLSTNTTHQSLHQNLNDKPATCPRCQQGVLLLRKGSRGNFWGCSTYPTCRHTSSHNDKQKRTSFTRSKNLVRQRKTG